MKRATLNRGLRHIEKIDAVFERIGGLTLGGTRRPPERQIAVRYESSKEARPRVSGLTGAAIIGLSRARVVGTEAVGPFFGSGLEEVMLPTTLGGIGEWVFRGLSNLRVVYVYGGHDTGIRQWLSQSVSVITMPSRKTLIGTLPLWRARTLRDVFLP